MKYGRNGKKETTKMIDRKPEGKAEVEEANYWLFSGP